METINFKGKPISGSTTINHQVRHDLQISNDEYVMLTFLNNCQIEKRDITYELVWRKVGFNREEYDNITSALYARDFIRSNIVNERAYIRVSKRFKDAFLIKESDFDAFWYNPETGTADWPGSRTDAMSKYMLVRKQYDHEYLMKQKNWYFRLLKLPVNSFRQKMGASVFLNIKTKRFEEDFEAQWREVTGVPLKQQPVQPLTVTEKEKLFV